jgi:acyl-CoA thioesterase-1
LSAKTLSIVTALFLLAYKAYGAMRALRNLTLTIIFTSFPVFAEPLQLVALGDSLTQGYGLPVEQGLVPQLQAWLDERGAGAVVQNAGVSGDTTAGGRARLDWALSGGADAVMVALGGNDLLRGLPASEARANLDAILAEARGRNLPVLLIGLAAPGNYGPDYKAAFDSIWQDLSQKHDTLLLDNLLAPIMAFSLADRNALGLMQNDGIHPAASGVSLIVAELGPKVLELLQSAKPTAQP